MFRKCPCVLTEELSGVFLYQAVGGVLVTAMALVLFAAVSYHCAATWRWLRGLARDGEPEGEDALSKQAAIRISHSLPDLQSEPTRQEYVQEPKEVKKVRTLLCPDYLNSINVASLIIWGERYKL